MTTSSLIRRWADQGAGEPLHPEPFPFQTPGDVDSTMQLVAIPDYVNSRALRELRWKTRASYERSGTTLGDVSVET